MDSRLMIGPGIPTLDPTARAPWNMSSISPHRLMELAPVATTGSIVPSHPFPTVDVPDHAHYTIGVVILFVGITGILGNFLVIYAFCSMMTLMVIAVDRYVVITRPLASLGVMSRKKALSIVAVAWVYSMGWSLPPFFGWSAYVPEGLMTSCSWDYMTFTPSVRSYTMLLFTFVFFIPLFIIIFCYCCIFRAIRHTTRYADLLTPYMNSVPAVIAKASAIHNPIIYAITHPKYRLSALSRYIPYLGALLCVTGRDRFSSSSFQSTRRSTLTSQSESKAPGKTRTSSQSESESARFSDTEEDCSSRTPITRQLSSDVKQVRCASQRLKVRGYSTGEFERTAAHTPTDPAICHLSQITTLTEPEDISMSDISLQLISRLPATLDNVMEESGPRTVCKTTSSVIVTSISSPSILHSPPGFHGNHKLTKTYSSVAKEPLDVSRLETTALQ
ncbi:hypothetical protein INR49_005714 [Caranx melampygus]|nr:hypothetical protein INR49_005714 [Caranx melampygus]